MKHAQTLRAGLFALITGLPALAAEPAAPRYVPEDHRPPMFYREDFNNEPEETPITQASIANKALTFGLYGPGKDGVAKSKHASPKDDPSYVWLGSCLQACGFTLKHRDAYADLTGLAKIRWRTKQTGFHQLRLMLKLADGTLLVSSGCEGASNDWRETEMTIADQRWRKLDAKVMNDGAWVDVGTPERLSELDAMLVGRYSSNPSNPYKFSEPQGA
jgi:hypothetical protein